MRTALRQQVTRVSIFLASPGELADERVRVRVVAAALNRTWSRFTHVEFHVLGWEEVPSGMGREAQEVINRYIGDDYDVFLGLMGSTLGSPTSVAPSGTVEEYERALVRNRVDPQAVELMFYFKKSSTVNQAEPMADDPVEQFRQRLKEDGLLYKTFDSREELGVMLHHDLGIIMQNWANRSLPVEAKGRDG